MVFIILCTIIVILYTVYLYLTWNFSYWKTRNVPFLKPKLIWGNVANSFLFRKSVGKDYADIYNSFPNLPYGGFFRLRQPALMIRDPELLRSVLVKDFANFCDNDFQVSEKTDPMLGKNPFTLPGDKWKVVRSQLTPGFTAGKIKGVFELIMEVCNDLIHYMDNNPELNNENGVEVKDLTAKYTTDVVATCAFGLKGNSFVDSDAKFREMGKKIVNSSFWTMLQHLGIIFFPQVASLLKFRFIPKKVADWFQHVIDQTVAYRDNNNVSRNDFLQMLIELKHKSTEYDFTNKDIAAHAVTFFTDGFETSSTVLALALYELALNPVIQNKLYEEIETELKANNGKFTYESVQNMTYLDRVVAETMRKYPPLAFMGKICTAPFKLPSITKDAEAEVTVEVGTSVVVSILGVQRDPNHYPDPLRFDPDRFTEEEESKRHKYTYLPFSVGPRYCLGTRLALTQTKIGLATIISKMEVRPCKKTSEPKFEPGVLFSVPKEVWLKFHKRHNQTC